MSNTITSLEQDRHATLKLSHGDQGPVLACRVPLHCTQADFLRVSTDIYALINRLTGCNCMSGRISVVVEDTFADVIRVNLDRVEAGVR